MNRVILTGTVIAKPFRISRSAAIMKIIATGEYNEFDGKEQTERLAIICNGPHAITAMAAEQGQQVEIEGTLRGEEVETADGKKRIHADIYAGNIVLKRLKKRDEIQSYMERQQRRNQNTEPSSDNADVAETLE